MQGLHFVDVPLTVFKAACLKEVLSIFLAPRSKKSLELDLKPDSRS